MQNGQANGAIAQRASPDYLSYIDPKYVKLGYHILITHGWQFVLLPLSILAGLELRHVDSLAFTKMWAQLQYSNLQLAMFAGFLVLVVIVSRVKRQRAVYLVDYVAWKPPSSMEVTYEDFVNGLKTCTSFTKESSDFQFKILNRCGIGPLTYVPQAGKGIPALQTLTGSRAEAEVVMFGCMEQLFAKTGLRPRQIDILVVNCSLFCPTPSLSAMLVNRFKMRSNILTYNLGGMGCSAGVIAMGLVKDLLQVHRGARAVILSTENLTQNSYFSNDRSMLITNVLFRVGCAAALLTSRRRDYWRAKYRLMHVVRTHKGADDMSYNCVMQKEDEWGVRGVSLDKNLMVVAGAALKDNITRLGPKVLPFSEQLLFALNWIGRKVLKLKLAPYQPDFKLAFEHFCIHAGGRYVIDELEKSLDLTPAQVLPSRATLYRFGNTSSSSVWYELKFSEAAGKIKKGDRIWQIAFGSGFKCNSAVWQALRTIPRHWDDVADSPWAGLDVRDVEKYIEDYRREEEKRRAERKVGAARSDPN
eukprot:jgi/Mesvir1/21405/Mv20882-RA.1